MKTPKIPDDELFQVERVIAQRADELSRERGFDPTRALDHWRQAENEVWERLNVARDLASEYCTR